MKRFFLPGLIPALMAMVWSNSMLAASPTNAPVLPPTVSYLTPEQEQKTFFMQPGYHLELVLSDPVIKEPVLTVFDGDGRMFVAEMRTYMQDVDGTGQRLGKSRVSVHWSSRHNGVYDKHAVFVDNLVLPRMVLPLANGVVINETDSEDYWLYTDTKGNGVADKKELFYRGGGRGGNLEHQPSGLIWDIDNRIYMAMNAYRFRVQGTNVTREPISINGGQWGASQDDYGKVWYCNAGAECGPLYFQVPPQYGYFDPQTPESFREVWPLIGLADVQGGTGRFRPQEKNLNHFTGTCGGEIYRGDRLPQELRGDYFFAEPVGRLIRRAKVEVHDGITSLSNPYEKSEFIRSTDPDFRPVNLANAPDGTLYITDMYRGIIQERDWVNQGSYLRGVVLEYQLDKNFGRGRIWRVVHDSMKPGPQPHLQNEKPAGLVKYLAHPNGWWRDTAQKLLVLRGDKSVVPALQEMARSNRDHLARIHALWTLEGLGALDTNFVREKLRDEHPQVRVAAIRASETLYKQGERSLVPDIENFAKDPDPNVELQVLESALFLKWNGWQDLINHTVASTASQGVKVIAGQFAPAPPPVAPHAPPPSQFTVDEKKTLDAGEIIFKQLCFACHGMDGKGAPFQGKPGATMAPPLSGSPTATGHSDAVIDVLLKGLSGPVEGKTYDAQMVPMESNDDAWVASVISYVRNNFGNHATFITSDDVARVRAAIKEHTNTWTIQELRETVPQPIPHRKDWKLTASNNAATLPFAVDGNLSSHYSTGAAQAPGMWVQVELPEETEIAGIELDSGRSGREFPRAYKVELSDNGTNWGTPVAAGNATALHNQIRFRPTATRFIRITQTGSDSVSPWSIYELQVLKVLSAEELTQTPNQFSPFETTTRAVQIKPAERTPFTVE